MVASRRGIDWSPPGYQVVIPTPVYVAGRLPEAGALKRRSYFRGGLGLVLPISLPEASKMEYPVCLPA